MNERIAQKKAIIAIKSFDVINFEVLLALLSTAPSLLLLGLLHFRHFQISKRNPA